MEWSSVCSGFDSYIRLGTIHLFTTSQELGFQVCMPPPSLHCHFSIPLGLCWPGSLKDQTFHSYSCLQGF